MSIPSYYILILSILLGCFPDKTEYAQDRKQDINWDTNNYIKKLKEVEYTNANELNTIAEELLGKNINNEANTIAQYYIYKSNYFTQKKRNCFDDLKSIYPLLKELNLTEYLFEIDIILYNHYYLNNLFLEADERLRLMTDYIFLKDREFERTVAIQGVKSAEGKTEEEIRELLKVRKDAVKAYSDMPWTHNHYLLQRRAAATYALLPNNLEQCYHELEELEKKCIANNRKAELGDLYMNIGFLKFNLENKYEEAKIYINKSIQAYVDSGHTSHLGVSYILLGHIDMAQEKFDDAYNNYSKANGIIDKSPIETQRDDLTYTGWALFNADPKEATYYKAKEYYDRAKEISNERGVGYKMALQREMWSLNSINREAEAQEIEELITTIENQEEFFKNKIKNIKTSTLTDLMLKDAEIKELSLSNKIQKVNNKNQKNLLYLSLFAILSSLLFLYYLYKRNMFLQSLEEKSIIIEQQNNELSLVNQKIKNHNNELNNELKKNLMLLANQYGLNEEIMNIFNSNKSDREMKTEVRKLISNTFNKELIKNINIDLIERNKTFSNNLTSKFPDLTNNNIKLCIYIKMKLSTKDIASMLHRSTSAIKIAKFRLRKKFDIEDSNIKLSTFLAQFDSEEGLIDSIED